MHGCSKNLVYMGTLGKAAGVAGAFVAAHESVIEWLVQKARSYIYTTAASPALAHALLASLDIIFSAEGAERRTHLQKLVTQFRSQLSMQDNWSHGLFLSDSQTHIQPLIIGKNFATLQLSARLYEAGIWVPAIRPPTVPEGTARLRVSLSAAHSHVQITALLTALNSLQKKVA